MRRELAWINSRSEARRALGPLGNRLRAGGRPFPMQETPTLQDLCLQGSHRSCVCPPSMAPLFKALKISRSAGPSFLLCRASRPGPVLSSFFPFHQHLDPRAAPSLLSLMTQDTATSKRLWLVLQSCSFRVCTAGANPTAQPCGFRSLWEQNVYSPPGVNHSLSVCVLFHVVH